MSYASSGSGRWDAPVNAASAGVITIAIPPTSSGEANLASGEAAIKAAIPISREPGILPVNVKLEMAFGQMERGTPEKDERLGESNGAVRMIHHQIDRGRGHDDLATIIPWA